MTWQEEVDLARAWRERFKFPIRVSLQERNSGWTVLLDDTPAYTFTAQYRACAHAEELARTIGE